jgi:hypothetical protein
VTVHTGVQTHTFCDCPASDGCLEHAPPSILACCLPDYFHFVLYYQ